MIARRGGHVVTISSLMGMLPGASLSDYCASKFATVGLTQCLRLEMIKLTGGAVSTSLICPYVIKTDMFQGITVSFQWLFPVLRPRFVASKVLEAVQYKHATVRQSELLSLQSYDLNAFYTYYRRYNICLTINHHSFLCHHSSGDSSVDCQSCR
jgi:all-trans-retinol dehydrogenase (NAD+)